MLLLNRDECRVRAIAQLKYKKVSLFTIILHNSEN